MTKTKESNATDAGKAAKAEGILNLVSEPGAITDRGRGRGRSDGRGQTAAAAVLDGRLHRRADADRRLALSGGRGPGRPGDPLAEPPDPLRPRHAERRGPHRRDPGRGRQARGRRRGLARHGRRARRSSPRPATASPGRPRSAPASRSSSSSRRTRRCWSTAGSSRAGERRPQGDAGRDQFRGPGRRRPDQRQRGGHGHPTQAGEFQHGETVSLPGANTQTVAPAAGAGGQPRQRPPRRQPPAGNDLGRSPTVGEDPRRGRGRDASGSPPSARSAPASIPRSRPRRSARAGTRRARELEVLRGQPARRPRPCTFRDDTRQRHACWRRPAC